MTFPFYESAAKESVRSCNLCGSTRYALIATRDRYGLDVPVVKCTDCGLIFLSYRMTAEAYREFYELGHYRALVAQYVKRDYPPEAIERDQAFYVRLLITFLTPHIEPIRGGLLLDLAGATGVVAEKLAQEFNLDATVVESSASEAQRARGRGLAVAQVPIEEYANGGNHYDLITLCRSVDHLLDIKGTLAKIRGWLAPGGLFYVDFVTAPIAKIDHPYVLSKKTMGRYLEQAGFKVKLMAHAPDGRHDGVLCEGA